MIAIFSTGGTFDKVYFDAKSEFTIGDPQAEPLLKEANISCDYVISAILKKDSLDMSDADRALITKSIQCSPYQQIVVTHGTDGMVATAKAIIDGNPSDKTIVLVGAMQPARMRYSDAPFNLGFAIASVQLLPAGVYIAMNGQIFTHDQLVKNQVVKNRATACFEATNQYR